MFRPEIFSLERSVVFDSPLSYIDSHILHKDALHIDDAQYVGTIALEALRKSQEAQLNDHPEDREDFRFTTKDARTLTTIFSGDAQAALSVNPFRDREAKRARAMFKHFTHLSKDAKASVDVGITALDTVSVFPRPDVNQTVIMLHAAEDSKDKGIELLREQQKRALMAFRPYGHKVRDPMDIGVILAVLDGEPDERYLPEMLREPVQESVTEHIKFLKNNADELPATGFLLGATKFVKAPFMDLKEREEKIPLEKSAAERAVDMLHIPGQQNQELSPAQYNHLEGDVLDPVIHDAWDRELIVPPKTWRRMKAMERVLFPDDDPITDVVTKIVTITPARARELAASSDLYEL